MSEDATTPPDALPLDEAARRILSSGSALGRELGGVGGAFRDLLLAELSLSRSAVLRAIMLVALAVVLGTSAWLYAMAMVVLGLHALGLAWWQAAGISALASLLLAGACAWWARLMLEDARFLRTRRLLARLQRAAADPADGEN